MNTFHQGAIMKIILVTLALLIQLVTLNAFAQPSGNLSIGISSSAELNGVIGNDTITYNISYAWYGNFSAHNLTVTNILPAEVSLLSTVPEVSQRYGRMLTWSVDSLDDGEFRSIDIIGLVQTGLPVGSLFYDTARISGPVIDEDSIDNVALSEVTVESPFPSLWVGTSIALETPEGTTLQVAEQDLPITITVGYANYSSFMAPSVVLRDTLPDPTGHSQLFVSASVTPTSITQSLLSWDLGTLQPYETGEITITLRPTAKGSFKNITTIYSSTTADRDSSDNEDSWDYDVVPILEPVLTVPSLSGMSETDTISMGANPRFEGFAQAGSQVLMYFIPANGCVDNFLNCTSLDSYKASTITGPDRHWIMDTSTALKDSGLYYIYFLAKRPSDGEYSIYTRDVWEPLIIFINPYIDSMGIDESSFTIRVGEQVYHPGTLSCMVGGLRGDTITLSVLMSIPDSIANDPSRWNEYDWLVYNTDDNGTTVDTIVPNMRPYLGKRSSINKPLGWWQDLKDWFGCWESIGCDKKYEPPPPKPGCPGCTPIPRPRPRVGIDPAGYVYDPVIAKGNFNWPKIPPTPSLINNATVTAYSRETDTSWNKWPAENYYQVNPQVTDATTEDKVKQAGYYSFVVSGGQYMVTAQSPSYLDYTSPILTVINSPVYHNIGMRRAPKGQTTGIFGKDDMKTVPESYTLYQNYPNPFNPNTIIAYALPVASNVTLKVYDVLGREVATLINHERQSAGRYAIPFDAGALASGVYFYQLKTNLVTKTKKMLFTK